MPGAAFFDLDRTLLRGASGPIISRGLREAGLVSSRTAPFEGLLFKVFDVVGETLPAMILSRQGARFAAGWEVATVQRVAEDVADHLVEAVQPFARELIAGHRAEGRPVVLATTSPADLIEPFAKRLGLDAVIATRHGVRDGRYDGTIDGLFVWGPGKLESVRQWAGAQGIDLAESYAYSDSFYDQPLLGAVGHPTVVNPDPRLRVVAVARRWPTVYLDVPPGIPKLGGIEPQRAVLAFTRPEFFPYARFDIAGVENIPERGGALLVANHRSYFDVVTLALTMAKSGRPARFLGKKEVFDAPIVGDIARAFGGIRVDRGTGSDEPLEAAASALRAGELVAMMPQGTIPRGPAFFETTLKGRWGAARLAAMTGVPVVPVGLWGTEQVWPRSARLPNVLNVTDPPHIQVRVGTPVKLVHKDLEADTKRIMKAITKLLPAEARQKHEPSPEELARTYPPGYKGEPERETDRRPGHD